MKKYEVMFIVDIANEEVIQAAVKLVQDTIVRIGGTVTKVDEWGKRHLAYEVKHQNEGYYAVGYVSYEAAPAFESLTLKLTRHRLRNLTVSLRSMKKLFVISLLSKMTKGSR